MSDVLAMLDQALEGSPKKLIYDINALDRLKIDPGIYNDLSGKDYHSSFGISKSGLDKINQSPFHYLYNLQFPDEQTKAMRIGSALHTMVLEPEKFDLEFIVPSLPINARTKEGQAAKKALESSGKTVLSIDEHQLVISMTKAIRNHPGANALLSNGFAEQSIFHKHSDLEVLCKVRPDYRKITKLGKHIIVDVKTTDDASREEFIRKIVSFRYHVQAGYYWDIVEEATNIPVDEFIFVAVEKNPPHGVALYSCDWYTITTGRYEYLQNLAKYKECLHGGYWPCYGNDAARITLPNYARIKL